MRGVQVRSEHHGENQSEAIWIFRVERYDPAGNRIALVPVEMRGHTFEGSISDGDWVRTRGRMRSGTLRVTWLENLTTGASVHAKGMTRAAWIAVSLLLLIMLAWFGFLAYEIVTNSGPPPGFPGS